MGLRSSPYQAVQGKLVAEEMVLGNPGDQSNVFRWDQVVTKLPGSERYDPRLALVCTRSEGTAAWLLAFSRMLTTSARVPRTSWIVSRRVGDVVQ